MRYLSSRTGLSFVAVMFLPVALEAAASCTAQARYVKSEPKDDYGFKQALTLAVSGSGAGHGLISYTVSYKDKSGASLTDSSSESYKFVPSAATAGGGGGAGGAGKVVDDVFLGTGVSVVGVTVGEVSCYKDDKSKCTASATYVDSAPGSTKGKQNLSFDVTTGNCGAACHGYVNYTLKSKGADGAEKSASRTHKFDMSGSGGGGAAEIQIVDETLLAKCTKVNPCTVTAVAIDKVSCFAD